MTSNYPTKKQILEQPLKHPGSIIEFVKRWKKISGWPRPTKVHIAALLQSLGKKYGKPVKIVFRPQIPSAFYVSLIKTIVLKNTSVVSALHEFAHHLKPKDGELYACRWSIWLFRKCFPQAYSKLTWKGHMLLKCRQSPRRTNPPPPLPAPRR